MTTATLQDAVAGWFAGRLPDGWFAGPAEVAGADEEILVVGPLDGPELPEGSEEGAREAARPAPVKRCREDTRQARMRIADDAERLFGRKASWGASVGSTRRLFTTVNVPVMTRLRMPDRQVL